MTKQAVEDFGRQKLRVRKTAALRWTVSDALPLSIFHRYVHFFAEDFAKCTLSKMAILCAPSRNEMSRIERAVYRFEIYRNMFWKIHDLCRPEDQKNMFFRFFSSWENEQLACINNYFCEKVAPVFNDIVEHDVTWGEYRVQHASFPACDHLQHILSLGISKLHEIITAKPPKESCALLYMVCPPGLDLVYYLFQGLRAVGTSAGYSRISHVDMEKSFYHDTDFGPSDAWGWTQEDRFTNPAVSWYQNEDLRGWGYVLWDRRRLDEWDAMHYIRSEKRPKDLDYEWGKTQNTENMEESWKRRAVIHLAGGRGWWSADDESQVVWKKGAWSPYDDAKRRKKCPLCIGAVCCAPHRLRLKLPAKAG